MAWYKGNEEVSIDELLYAAIEPEELEEWIDNRYGNILIGEQLFFASDIARHYSQTFWDSLKEQFCKKKKYIYERAMCVKPSNGTLLLDILDGWLEYSSLYEGIVWKE